MSWLDSARRESAKLDAWDGPGTSVRLYALGLPMIVAIGVLVAIAAAVPA